MYCKIITTVSLVTIYHLTKFKMRCDENFYFVNFIYFWLCWVFVAAHGLSLVVASRGHSLVVVCRLLIAVAFLVV